MQIQKDVRRTSPDSYGAKSDEANDKISISVTCGSDGTEVPVSVWNKTSDQFAARLRKVARERRRWARKAHIFCYRVYDADLPDYSCAIDIYKGVGPDEGYCGVVIAEYQAPKEIDPLRATRRFEDVCAIVPVVLGIPADQVFVKQRRRAKGGGQYRDAKQLSHRRLCTAESGYLIEADLSGYLDTGIFLDHRVTRQLVGELARGKRFLNLFAYTGVASVHAAGAGAHTTTVDMSKTYLAWAKRNMEQNGFTGSDHRYINADVTAWISSAIAHGETYDIIFVDPPTFSNSKTMGQRTWSVQRDHAQLLSLLIRMLAPGGVIIFSCNLRRFDPDVERLAAAHIQMRDITARTIPHDFERNPRIHHCYAVVPIGSINKNERS
ncbi:MAG: class I SAM-dependent methyltransferase [Eggerthellaceae bacterium]|jgi:23S rRNA (guanine2445-N2)-methyltransferase / 23S rRNA (guanine2069-N7)-methyltransferase|nr:class I SAM-dependent methyltransferase [Eggerthellaceae bacterium]MCH4220699.1 class I SAM-dependent methyltransferase [Eggerthellaceae bacterium]